MTHHVEKLLLTGVHRVEPLGEIGDIGSRQSSASIGDAHVQPMTRIPDVAFTIPPGTEKRRDQAVRLGITPRAMLGQQEQLLLPEEIDVEFSEDIVPNPNIDMSVSNSPHWVLHLCSPVIEPFGHEGQIRIIETSLTDVFMLLLYLYPYVDVLFVNTFFVSVLYLLVFFVLF